MARTLENPLYYLDNFQRVLDWIGTRYEDLLDQAERDFIAAFSALPQSARAMLVRMAMRKGSLFRGSKLRYEEIGDTGAAVAPLVQLGWVDDSPGLSLEQVFGLLTKAELAQAFPSLRAGMKKSEQFETLSAMQQETRPLRGWHPAAADSVYAITIDELCERLKLMFFGNCYQDWTEFVLSDLGILRYEQVDISPASRGFRCREDIDHYLRLHRCRQFLEQGEPADELFRLTPQQALENPWLEGRRQKLLFAFGQHYERAGETAQALNIYTSCSYEGARIRAIRVMEKCGQVDPSHALAATAWEQPESEAERQHLMRTLPRLKRKLGLAPLSVPALSAAPEFALRLDKPELFHCVELTVRDHLDRDGMPMHYVENTLMNSLFGLLCWQAVFTALPGAFFHPFHSGPVDLYRADFLPRRAQQFAACLEQLDSDAYRDTIRRHYREKHGLQSPFVFWEALSEELLEQALACIPPQHLRLCFQRMLLDIRANRAGLPDLIRFDLGRNTYEMIEVKGPGDRLQDNQLRWNAFFMQHGMPVSVCYVEWTPSA